MFIKIAFLMSIYTVIYYFPSLAYSNSPSQKTNLTHYKIHPEHYQKYSNRYKKDDTLPKVSGYLSNWTHYQQGFEPNIDELSKYDIIMLSFFGLCGTEIGDPTIISAVQSLQKQCTKEGAEKYTLMTTDIFSDTQKAFSSAGISGSWNKKWLADNPAGMLGVMKKLHEEKGTMIGVSIFGWSLSNIASDAVKPENRKVFIDSIIKMVEAYPFIGELDIDWEYPAIKGAEKNKFDKENDASNYKDFVSELKTRLVAANREDITLGIACGATIEKIDAIGLKDLVAAGIQNIHLMTYDFSGQWDNKVDHHTNLIQSDNTDYSADKAVQYIINEIGIAPENIHIGCANYSRNFIVDESQEKLEFNPVKGKFTPDTKTLGTFEIATCQINDIMDNFMDISESGAKGKNGYTLYTDQYANADFLFNNDKKIFISYDTPRTVFAKSQYAIKHKLGGVFTWMVDPDEGLMFNAIKEGLGYKVSDQKIDMKNIINSCGENIDAKTCSTLTYLNASKLTGVNSKPNETHKTNIEKIKLSLEITFK